jgi:hypothetical protein
VYTLATKSFDDLEIVLPRPQSGLGDNFSLGSLKYDFAALIKITIYVHLTDSFFFQDNLLDFLFASLHFALNIETYHLANAICLWLCIPRDGTLLLFCDFLFIGIILHLLHGHLLLWNQSHYLLITRRTDVNFLFIQQAFTFFFFMCIILFQQVFSSFSL